MQSPKVFVVGMPKSGTSSIYEFFRCGGYARVTHQMCGNRTCARCIWENTRLRRPLLHGCDDYSVYTQLDEDGLASDRFCFFPQRNLSLLHAAYPSSTFILNTRNPIHWVNSVTNWNTLRARLARCKLGRYDFRDDAQLIDFYQSHNEYVRSFARTHGHALIEIDIEGDVKALAARTNINASCFIRANQRQHRVPQHTCFVGDSLVRYMWCWHEFRDIANCHHHADRVGATSRYYWAPTIADVLRNAYAPCTVLVWNNLFHEVRANPASFRSNVTRAHTLGEVHANLSARVRRVIFYVSQPPTGTFAHELHANVSMMDAWRLDHALADERFSKWLTVRADLHPHQDQTDGRHYGASGIEVVHATLRPLLAARRKI